MDLIMILKDYQTLITGIIATVIIIAGFSFTYKQLDYMKKDRHSGLAMNLWSIWNSNALIESRKCLSRIEIEKESLCEKIKEYDNSDPEKYLTIVMVGNYYEHMGLLVSKGYLDPNLIIDLFGYTITNYYEQYSDYIIDSRNDKMPELFTYFEELNNKANDRGIHFKK